MRAVGPERAKVGGRSAVEARKATPTDEPLFGPGSVRADGRRLNPTHLFQVKSPEESRYLWHSDRPVRTIRAE